jgi:hypothetical protein
VTKSKRKTAGWESPPLDKLDWGESPLGPVSKPEPGPSYDPRLADFFEAARVARRKKMSAAELYRDLLEELRSAAELRTILYEAELARERPRIPRLIKLWCDQSEALEFAAMATPPTHDAGAFEDEMKICDRAIDKLSEPFLKKLRPA